MSPEPKKPTKREAIACMRVVWSFLGFNGESDEPALSIETFASDPEERAYLWETSCPRIPKSALRGPPRDMGGYMAFSDDDLSDGFGEEGYP